MGLKINTAKEKLLKLIDEMSESEVVKILEFTERIRLRKGTNYAKELSKTSDSTDLWDNDLDDYI